MYAKLKWLFENVGDTVRCVRWYSPRLYRYLWIGKSRDGMHAFVATGTGSHQPLSGNCFFAEWNRQDQLGQVMKSAINMWPAKPDERADIAAFVARRIEWAYTLHKKTCRLRRRRLQEEA